MLYQCTWQISVLFLLCFTPDSRCQEPKETNNGEVSRANVRFYLYADASDTLRREELVTGDLKALEQSYYNVSRPVKILIHGWTQVWYLTRMIYPWSTKNAYLKYGPECNVIIVDYLRVKGFWNYLMATNVGMQEAMDGAVQFFAWLNNLGMIDLKKAHISGLSLGAPIAAAIAHGVHQATGVKMGRVTGLDPAGPGFAPRIPLLGVRHRMSPADADFVDIVHTNGAAIGLGIIENVGHADFHVNGGVEQPDCFVVRSFCSHILSAYYFEKSIRLQDRKERCACATYARYTDDPQCCDTLVVFGEYANSKRNGSFYITYEVNVVRAVLGMLDRTVQQDEQEEAQQLDVITSGIND